MTRMRLIYIWFDEININLSKHYKIKIMSSLSLYILFFILCLEYRFEDLFFNLILF
jgi:hypothetical protein